MKTFRYASILGIAGLLLAAVSSSASTHGAASQECPRTGVHVLLADTQARVYVVPNYAALKGPFKTTYDKEGLNVRACAYGQKRSYKLATYPECPESGETVKECVDAEQDILSNAMLAYPENIVSANKYGTEPRESSWQVVVRDLRTGRVLHRVPTGTPLKPEPHYTGVGPALAIVVKGDGVVAWLAEDKQRSQHGATFYDIGAADRTGTRLIASGTDISPSSLRLTGNTLHWKQDGKPMSSTLN
jgi:hypothetical protein